MLSRSLGDLRPLIRKCVWLVPLFLFGTPVAFSQQKLKTPQETNERIRQLATAMRVKQGEYVIGSGDLLRIEVFDVPELTREDRVGDTGHFSLPLLPSRIYVNGLTASQLEMKVAELLQANGLVSHPQVTVYVKEHRSRPIMVVGAVMHPLVYQAIRQPTLLEVLTEAGGVANDAGSTVIVSRAANPTAASETDGSGENGDAGEASTRTITINLNDLLESGDPKFNIPLLAGDVVTVPRAGIVYVVGAVERQGGYVLQNDHEEMTTLRILALAGGLKGTAKPHQGVILRKNPDNGRRQEVAIDLGKIVARKSEDVRLLPNDILFVPSSASRRALRRTGEVAVGLATGVALFRLGR